MLQLTIPKGREVYNERTGEFTYTEKEYALQLEHSLVSLAKWETIHEKAFLKDDEEKTLEETLDYIKCMTITQNIPDEIYTFLNHEDVKKITDYITAKKSATFFNTINSEGNNEVVYGKKSSQIMTSELIYGYMVVLQIPWEAQKWHLNRLLTLIRVCNNLNSPKKKGKQSDTLRSYEALNKQRLAKFGS